MQFAYEVLSKITQEKFFLKLVQVGIIIDNNEQQGDVGSRSSGIETTVYYIPLPPGCNQLKA